MWSRLALVVLCSCDQLFGLDIVPPVPPIDAAVDGAAPVLAKWTAAAPLPSGRDFNHSHAAFVGSTLYLIGGYDVDQQTESDVVYRATLTQGELGAWTTTAELPARQAFGDVVTIGTRIFVVGGANGGLAQTTVYCGEPDQAGDLIWSSTSALPDARKAHGAAAANNYVYAVGGADASDVRYSTVFYARARSDCSLGSWQVTAPLPAPRASLGVVAARGFLYAIGGETDGTTAHADVYVTALDPANGQVAPWAATTSLPLARMALVALTDGSHIYVIGGLGSSATAEVRYSKIANDGTLGTWETVAPLLMARHRHSGVLANGHLFVLGGPQTAATSVEQSSQGAL